MALNRLFQLLALRETGEGIYNTAVATSAGAGLLVTDPVLTIAPESFDRTILQGSLTPVQPISGAIPATMTFRIECAGDTAVTPLWYPLVEACGFKLFDPIQIMTIGAVTAGPFVHGELATQATSGATGIVMMDTYDGNLELVLGSVTGSPDATNIWSGAAASATASAVGSAGGAAFEPADFLEFTMTLDSASVVSSPAIAGTIWENVASGCVLSNNEDIPDPTTGTFTFRILNGTPPATGTFTSISPVAGDNFIYTTPAPILSVLPTVSLGMVQDGRLITLRSARGNVTFSGELGQPMFMDFEMSGVFQAVVDGLAFDVTSTSRVPPVLTAATTGIGSDDTDYDTFTEEFNPCISTMALNFGNTVSPRRCMNDASGIANFAITSRAPTLTFDPELVAEAVFPWVGDFTGSIAFRFQHYWGALTDNGFALWAPGCQTVTESIGDRDGIATSEITANLSGKLAGGGDGVRREVVFIHKP